MAIGDRLAVLKYDLKSSRNSLSSSVAEGLFRYTRIGSVAVLGEEPILTEFSHLSSRRGTSANSAGFLLKSKT